MKPDWKDAPEWAQWLSMDGDGLWSWWEILPTWDHGENDWFVDIDTVPEGSNGLALYATDTPDESGIDWDHAFDTLEARP